MNLCVRSFCLLFLVFISKGIECSVDLSTDDVTCKFGFSYQKFTLCQDKGFSVLPSNPSNLWLTTYFQTKSPNSGPLRYSSNPDDSFDVAYGYYYSNANLASQQTAFISPELDVSKLSTVVITFQWVMNGADVGDLYLVLEADSTKFNTITKINSSKPLITGNRIERLFKSGDQNIASWQDAKETFNVLSFSSIKVFFQVIPKKQKTSGDIAIDLVVFKSGPSVTTPAPTTSTTTAPTTSTTPAPTTSTTTAPTTTTTTPAPTTSTTTAPTTSTTTPAPTTTTTTAPTTTTPTPAPTTTKVVPVNATWINTGVIGQCNVTCGHGYKSFEQVCQAAVGAAPITKCDGRNPGEKRNITTPCTIWLNIEKQSCDVDGKWSEWSNFTACPITCGKSRHSRKRMCTNPPPSGKGLMCETTEGVTSMEEIQYRDCTVDCNGNWTDWKCICDDNVPFNNRTRNCSNPTPYGNGTKCTKLDGSTGLYEIEINATCVCPAQWSNWGLWSHCSATCGYGNKTRSRSCEAGQCVGKTTETVSCILTPSCPTGVWSKWSEWTTCSGTCGNRTRIRARSCPNSGIPPCEGTNTKMVEDCNDGCVAPSCDGFGEKYFCGFEEPFKTAANGFCRMGPEAWAYKGFGIGKSTPTDNTGPVIDDTFKSDCGHFSYFEASDSDSGWIISSPFSSINGTMCVSFSLSMYSKEPESMGEFHVSLWRNENDIRLFWKQDGGFTNNQTHWHKVYATLPSMTPKENYRLVFSSLRNDDHPLRYEGDMAFDNVKIVEGACDGPVDGMFTEWSTWGTCDKTCDIGNQTRSRSCTNPAPSNGGGDCIGEKKQIRECQLALCPVDGGWGMWNPWTTCSQSCGVGTQKRYRECSNSHPIGTGLDCLDETDNVRKKRDEEEQACNTNICSRDGGWSDWVQLSNCSVSCGNGTITHQRNCTSPAPIGDGKQCALTEKFSLFITMYGLTEMKTEPCYAGNCEENGGGWSQWGAYGHCSGTCDDGKNILQKTRSRTCLREPCFGNSTQNMLCNLDVKCPVNGMWSSWQNVTVCSASCGTGVLEQQRICNNPEPAHGGANCVGLSLQKIPCEGPPCPTVKNATWENTGVVYKCNVACGHGNKSYEQVCQAAMGAAPITKCDGRNPGEKRNTTTPCTIWLNTKEQSCNVNGGWGEWGNYSTCPVSCGGATRVRTRHCDNPPPSGNGVKCETEGGITTLIDTQSKLCDCDGNWADWQCVCDNNAPYNNETRSCSNPSPQGAGANCTKRDNTAGLFEVWENRTCQCGNPVDGNWTEWTAFSLCSATCGTEAVRTRTRNCSEPLFGGKECLKLDNETRALYEVNIQNCGLSCCQVDASWQSWWSNTSSCNATCENGGNGMGFYKRVRNCSGDSCDGIKLCPLGSDYFSTQVVFVACEENCTRNGDWDNYKDITSCSATCGSATKIQQRNCSNPTPRANGLECLFDDKSGRGLLENRTVPCENLPLCPIHGGWSLWTVWSNCSKECNGYGNTTRERYCNNPVPQHGGDICTRDNGTAGLSEIQSAPCYIYCPDPNDCNFEAQNFCNFITYDETPLKANRWLVESGETHTKDVGPNSAQEGTYYAYFESSAVRPFPYPGYGTAYEYQNETIILKNLAAFNGHRCLSFYYFAWQNISKSANFGYFNVKQISHMNGKENITTILSLNHSEEREWKHVLFDLVNEGYSYDILFEARAENHIEDKAIDDIKFFPVKCSVYNSTEIPLPSN